MQPGVLNTAFSVLTGIQLGYWESGRAYIAYPSLDNLRWLFPASPSAVRHTGISELMRPGSLRGRTFKALSSAGAIRGERVWLEEDDLEQLEAELTGALGQTDIYVAFFMGVPGAYRKVTAQVMTPAGETLAYAKIGTLPSTQEVLKNERLVLSRLPEIDRLRGKVPEVLEWFDWRGGNALLTTSGPRGQGPNRLSLPHFEFCEDVFFPFAREELFEESPIWTHMVETAFRLSPYLPPSFAASYDRALAMLRNGLGGTTVPMSLAHRDFIAPNTRLGPRGLFVFDWERAREGMSPLYDVFHFQAMQSIWSRRGRLLPDQRLLERLLVRLWPGGQEYLPYLYLAYLVDMSMIYSEAQIVAPGVGEQKVWHWFMKQIESFLHKGSPL